MLIESNWSYQEALGVIKQLEDRGLEAGVTVGAISIQGDPDEIRRICKELELPEPFEGLSRMQSRILESYQLPKDWKNAGR